MHWCKISYVLLNLVLPCMQNAQHIRCTSETQAQCCLDGQQLWVPCMVFCCVGRALPMALALSARYACASTGAATAPCCFGCRCTLLL
jgi:hypothetical protein